MLSPLVSRPKRQGPGTSTEACPLVTSKNGFLAFVRESLKEASSSASSSAGSARAFTGGLLHATLPLRVELGGVRMRMGSAALWSPLRGDPWKGAQSDLDLFDRSTLYNIRISNQ